MLIQNHCQPRVPRSNPVELDRPNVKPRVASVVKNADTDKGFNVQVRHGKAEDTVTITGFSHGPRGHYRKIGILLEGAGHVTDTRTYGANSNRNHTKATTAEDVAKELAKSIIANNPRRVYAEVRCTPGNPYEAVLVIRPWAKSDVEFP